MIVQTKYTEWDNLIIRHLQARNCRSASDSTAVGSNDTVDSQRAIFYSSAQTDRKVLMLYVV